MLASRCLHGAADDMRAFAASSSVSEIPAEALQSEALRLEQLAETMEGPRG